MRNAYTLVVQRFLRVPSRIRLLSTAFVVIIITVYGLSSGLFLAKNQAFADASRVVSVYFDGDKRVISTDANTVGEAINRAGVDLGPDDLVEPAADTKLPQGYFNINVYRARPVVVVDGAKSYQLRSAFQSSRLIVTAAGLITFPEDTYRSEVVTNFVGDGTVGEKVTIIRSKPLQINVDGKNMLVHSQGPTVGDVLKEKTVSLGEKDTIAPDLSTLVTPGLVITITRVAEVETKVLEVITRSSQTLPDPSQPVGFNKVKTEGSDGKRTVTYLIHYRNGVEIKRDTLKIEGEVKPVTKVVLEGTKVIFPGSIEYWRPKVEVEAAKWGVDPNRMLRIMACESGGDASNYNGRRAGISPQQAIKDNRAIGLFQFKPTTWDNSGGGDIWDGNRQVEVAAWKMGNYGFTAWECK